jgi:hypothetical protein
MCPSRFLSFFQKFRPYNFPESMCSLSLPTPRAVLLLVAASLLLINMRPAKAQPNVVEVKVAPGFFKMPYTIEKVHLRSDEEGPEGESDSLHVESIQTYDDQTLEPDAVADIMLGNREFEQLLSRLGLVEIRRAFKRRYFDPSAPQAPKALKSESSEIARIYFFTLSDSTGAKQFVERARKKSGVTHAKVVRDIKFRSHLSP